MQGRSKKEAKQVTAAAVLENLLEAVPMDNFLQSAKKVCHSSLRKATHILSIL